MSCGWNCAYMLVALQDRCPSFGVDRRERKLFSGLQPLKTKHMETSQISYWIVSLFKVCIKINAINAIITQPVPMASQSAIYIIKSKFTTKTKRKHEYNQIFRTWISAHITKTQKPICLWKADLGWFLLNLSLVAYIESNLERIPLRTARTITQVKTA